MASGNRVVIVNPVTLEDISPAIEETQQEILAELQESIAKNSLSFGTKRVTMNGSGVGVGPDQPCRTCVVSHTNTTTYVGSTEEGTPDALSFLLPTDTYLEIPVRNLNKLSFFGTAAEFVHILWRD
jgi:hypothetical protein